MRQELVINFSADGTIEYTRNTALNLFDGAGVMERVTDIKKCDEDNQYYIHWMLGPHAGHDHTHLMDRAYHSPQIKYAGDLNTAMLFPSYEAAVDHEITVLNAMRLKGITFGTSEQ